MVWPFFFMPIYIGMFVCMGCRDSLFGGLVPINFPNRFARLAQGVADAYSYLAYACEYGLVELMTEHDSGGQCVA